MTWLLITGMILAGLLALRFSRFEIRHEILIPAPVEQVWHTLIDFPSYSEWNSQLTYLGGEVKKGGLLHLRLAAAGADPYEFKPVVSYFEENTRFAWLAVTGVAGVFDGEHFFELSPAPGGSTRLINREEYRGILSQVMRHLPMMKQAPAGFVKMNEEIAARSLSLPR